MRFKFGSLPKLRQFAKFSFIPPMISAIHALSLLAIVTGSKGIFTNVRELQLRYEGDKLGSMDMKSNVMIMLPDPYLAMTLLLLSYTIVKSKK